MSHYDDTSDHGHYRSWSPDHYSGGSHRPAGGPYAAGAIPSPSEYEPHQHPPPLNHPRGPGGALQVPPGYGYDRRRPRSVPPPGAGPLLPAPHSHQSSRSRSRRDSHPSDSEDFDSQRPHTPLSKAKHVFENSFSSSTSGLGVGVLGAIVGGLAAREASEAAAKKGHHGSGKETKGQLISTIVGAAVGGLGANAIEKRLEMSRKKTNKEQEAWEKKWGKDSGSEGRRSGERERERELKDVEEGRGRRRGGSRGSVYEHGSGEDSDWEDLGKRRRSVSRRRY